MKVISLFDGIATGRLALEQLGFQNIEYEAYEMYFPVFKEGTMYKGMEVGKEYSLDELGL